MLLYPDLAIKNSEDLTRLKKSSVLRWLKYAILSPIIGRLYKGIVTGLIYKMNNTILKNEEIWNDYEEDQKWIIQYSIGI